MDKNTDFTNNAWEALYDAVDNEYFQDRDAVLIYQALENRLKCISFGEYLKRYIYRKAGLDAPFESISLREYQQIIKEAFLDNHTPKAFEPTTAKLSALSKNWLTQQTVKRKVVFLLGFGLAMSVEDVNDFLVKALKEQEINAKNPFEVICWYCYNNRYNYLKFEKLWQIYCATSYDSLDVKLLYSDLTIGVRDTMHSIGNDVALINFVSKLKTSDNKTQLSVTVRRYFDELFEQARIQVAQLYNQLEEEAHEKEVAQYQSMLLNNDKISDEERIEKIRQKKGRIKIFSKDDITESDLEHIICSAIPVDGHGNLKPGKASKLNDQFMGKRFSRQHISNILAGKSEVTRFDLITLNFFVFSQTLDEYPNIKNRYMAFLDSTNHMLEQCFLGQLYIANPYECFVLMCILSEDPLGTYADVWELSYGKT